MGDLTALLVAVALLAANAFFVGAEFALVSARQTQIEPKVADGSRAARVTLRAMQQVSMMMAGAQLGITVASLGLGAVGEPAVAHLIEGPLHALGVPDTLLHPIAFALALTVVVAFHMVLGEMVPKNIALAGPERAALVLGPPMYAVVTVLRPVIWLLNVMANLVLRLLRVEPQDEVATSYTPEEMAGLIHESGREGMLDEEHKRLVTGALELKEETAADVAIPLPDLVSVRSTDTVAEVEELCVRTGFSRFPVLGEAGDMEGYLHVKDLLDLDATRRDEPVPDRWVRRWVTVPADDSVQDALLTMQRRGVPLARVVRPASGETVGVVALEDLLEELVGEVRDATREVDERRSGQASSR